MAWSPKEGENIPLRRGGSFYARHVIPLFLIFPSCLLPSLFLPPSLTGHSGRQLPSPSSSSSVVASASSRSACDSAEAAFIEEDRKSNPKLQAASPTHLPIHPRETVLSLFLTWLSPKQGWKGERKEGRKENTTLCRTFLREKVCAVHTKVSLWVLAAVVFLGVSPLCTSHRITHGSKNFYPTYHPQWRRRHEIYERTKIESAGEKPCKVPSSYLRSVPDC